MKKYLCHHPIILFAILCSILTSCKANDPNVSFEETSSPTDASSTLSTTEYIPDTTEPKSRNYTTNLTSFDLTPDLKNQYEYDFMDFHIADKTYVAQSGRDMPYKLRGIIGIPKGDKPFPIVFITHGSHENQDETKRFDTGFEYLVKTLAQNGYIAISMDMSMPYIWKYGDGDDNEKSAAIANEHIDSIIKANNGEDLYPVNLKGKVDVEKIALIGHSRGGETIFQIAAQQKEKGINIDTLLSIAPSWGTMRTFPNVSASILVPQYDGDVARLDGVALFDYLSANNKGDYSLIFLMGANHNYFNENIEKDDSEFYNTEGKYPSISRKEQVDFLKNYAVDFLNDSLGIENQYYRLSQPQPNTMYGRDIRRRIHTTSSIELIDTKTADSFSSGSADVKHLIDSYFYKEDEVLVDTVTLGLLDEDLNVTKLNRNLINIEWNNMGEFASFIPLHSDLSNKNALSINIVPDSASSLNQMNTAIEFTVMLKDSQQNTSSVVIPKNQNALLCYPGKLSELELDVTYEYWDTPTPLGAVNIPLSLFEGIDLSDIQAIELIFHNSDSGGILIDSIQAQ